jgi:RHS repeat-associated protein
LKTYFLNGFDVLSDGTSKFLHGAGIDQPLQLDSGTLSASYLQDRLGSTSQLVDAANATAKARLDYKSYGKLEGGLANPESRNPFTYTAREDDGTGLMYYRARYYDPELEMFVSQDPLGQAQRYVQGNPLRFRDPRGLQEEFDPFGEPRYEDPNEALEEYEREHALDYSGPNVFPNGNQTPDPITEDPCPLEFPERQLQRKFNHAQDFGVEGNYSPENESFFEQAIRQHLGITSTRAINGTYRGQAVIHYYNPITGLNVITTPNGNFVSGWRLSPAQTQNLINRSSLGGGP